MLCNSVVLTDDLFLRMFLRMTYSISQCERTTSISVLIVGVGIGEETVSCQYLIQH